jgi:HD-GYP domain-containing protein (c-di-GMP phosphodiesterase class II)
MANVVKKDTLEEVAAEQNHYASHLAEVNKSNDVIATKDVYNENGLLVVPMDTAINHEIADKILRHRLIEPLEEQVQLENALDGNGLNEGIDFFLGKYSDVRQVHSDCEFQTTLNRLVTSDILFPILLQELTVMQETLPNEYYKTLFCAWLSALLAREMELNDEFIRISFLAGLTHDIGLLHISPDILHKKDAFTAAEWRAMQSHVVVGQLLLKKLDGKNSRAARAVLEHHERCDGSGYPVGRNGEHLDIIGQIVGMADSIQAIRVNQFEEVGRNLRDTMPFLHMNSHVYPLAVYEAMCSVLKKSNLKPSVINPFCNTSSLISTLLSRGEKLNDSALFLAKIMELKDSIKEGTSYHKVISVAQPVAKMIDASGLIGDEISAWLKNYQTKDENRDLQQLSEMELMQNELYWQLKRVGKFIKEFLDNDGDKIEQKHREELEGISSHIDDLSIR